MMDKFGGHTDNHIGCGGTIMRDSTHDSLYCTGCMKWVEEVCSDKDCGFCKDRPKVPRRQK